MITKFDVPRLMVTGGALQVQTTNLPVLAFRRKFGNFVRLFQETKFLT